MIRRLLMMCMCAAAPCLLHAQIDKEMEEFDNFVKQQQQEFNDFVEQQNKEFAEFLKETWKLYDLQKPVDRPKRPEPVKPVNFDKSKPLPKPQEIKIGSVTRLPVPEVEPSATFPTAGRKPTPVPTLPGGTAKPYAKPDGQPATPPAKPSRPAGRPVADRPTSKPVTDRPVAKPNEDLVTPIGGDATRPVAGGSSSTRPSTPPQAAPRAGMPVPFYGEDCYVDASLKSSFRLNGISEKEVAAGWETLCRTNYQKLVADCLAAKRERSMNDYGYLLFTQQVAEKLCGVGRPNEVALMQMFLLCQSGYKVKVARVGSQLGLFFASNDVIYAVSFLTIGGVKYYKFGDPIPANTAIYTYNRDFANSTNAVAMSITAPQTFNGDLKIRQLKARDYPSVALTSQVNDGLIAFYKDYPQCDFSVYVGAPVSPEVQASVLPPLKAAIQGKSQAEAANILIDFVQTAFQYQTDDQQFGYEKPFFVDEVFYYPYCDCEDRSILYSYLVRTLMGLDVVLLDYPNHIATAVCFDEPVSGDYLTIEGKKYVVCDPTYIGASIGKAMPQYKNVAARVLKY